MRMELTERTRRIVELCREDLADLPKAPDGGYDDTRAWAIVWKYAEQLEFDVYPLAALLGEECFDLPLADTLAWRRAVRIDEVDSSPVRIAISRLSSIGGSSTGEVAKNVRVPSVAGPKGALAVYRSEGGVPNLSLVPHDMPHWSGDVVAADGSHRLIRLDTGWREFAETVVEGPEAEETWKELQRVRRLLLAVELCGAMRAVLEISCRYSEERVQFGNPIGAYQAIQHELVDILVAVETAELLCGQAWDRYTRKRVIEPEDVEIVWQWTSHGVRSVLQKGFSVHGGVGFMRTHQMVRHSEYALSRLAIDDRPRGPKLADLADWQVNATLRMVEEGGV